MVEVYGAKIVLPMKRTVLPTDQRETASEIPRLLFPSKFPTNFLNFV